MIYGAWGESVPEGHSYTTSGTTVTTDTGKWVTGTAGSSWPTTGHTVTISTPPPPIEYTLEDGTMKWKDEVTDGWYEMNKEPDPFVLKAKPKKAVKVRAKIKLDKKLGVDVEKLADLLF